MSKRVSIILGILQIFIGVGAVAGGYAFISDPSGRGIGIPLEFLQGSPFPNYLIPGIVLFTVNGLGSLAAGILTFKRWSYAGELAVVFGAGLMVWIIVQVTIIPYSWFQPVYFGLGLLELVLGLWLRRH